MFMLKHKWPHGMENLLATSLFALIATLAAGLLLAPDLLVKNTPIGLITAQDAADLDILPDPAPYELTAGSVVTPASALADGRPALVLFYPTDMCSYRYCRLPIELEIEVRDRFGETVTFVVIHTQSIPAGISPAQAQATEDGAWEIYPKALFADWLPAPVKTPFGTGLEAPVVVLVNSQNEQVLQTDEYPSWREIERNLVVLTSK
jgi:hypothetical protein